MKTSNRVAAGILLSTDPVSLKRVAWAFGCSKKGSEEERQLRELLILRVEQGDS